MWECNKQVRRRPRAGACALRRFLAALRTPARPPTPLLALPRLHLHGVGPEACVEELLGRRAFLTPRGAIFGTAPGPAALPAAFAGGGVIIGGNIGGQYPAGAGGIQPESRRRRERPPLVELDDGDRRRLRLLTVRGTQQRLRRGRHRCLLQLWLGQELRLGLSLCLSTRLCLTMHRCKAREKTASPSVCFSGQTCTSSHRGETCAYACEGIHQTQKALSGRKASLPFTSTQDAQTKKCPKGF